MAKIHNGDGYKRAFAHYFENAKVKPSDLLIHEFKNDKDRFEAWSVDSMQAAFKALEAREYALALRCFAQACEYRGRMGGTLPGPALNDALTALSCGLQDTFRELEVQAAKGGK